MCGMLTALAMVFSVGDSGVDLTLSSPRHFIYQRDGAGRCLARDTPSLTLSLRSEDFKAGVMDFVAFHPYPLKTLLLLHMVSLAATEGMPLEATGNNFAVCVW